MFLYDFTGYGYVLAWGIAFYPQVFMNWKRKSTAGMSVGLVWYNVLGFSVYLVYTLFALDCAVQDSIFAAHALFLTLFTLLQVRWYGTELTEFPQIHGKITGVLLMILDICLVLNVGRWTSFMSLVYACGYLKTVVTLVKYTPQLYLNYTRKSTVGFAIGYVAFDITGGTLSILQQFIACKYSPVSGNLRSQWSWEPFVENKPKLLLGLISIFYDCCFLYQRFVLYPTASAEKGIGACETSECCNASGKAQNILDDVPGYKRGPFRPAMASARIKF